MKYCIVDLETGSKEYLGRKGSFLVNDIVAVGLKPQGLNAIAHYVEQGTNQDELDDYIGDCLVPYDIIVGHNIKYDLLYLWKFRYFQKWLSKGGRIWDTQLAEYMLTGHQHKFSALRDIAVNKYGCKEREKLMEAYWEDNVKVLNWSNKKIIKTFEKGTNNLIICKWLDNNPLSVDIIHGPIDTKDIPKKLVLEDVTNDVLDTEQVMLQQVKQSKKEGMYAILMEQMEGLLATTEMEYNGIYQNKDIMTRNKSLIEKEIEALKQEALNIANKYWKSS